MGALSAACQYHITTSSVCDARNYKLPIWCKKYRPIDSWNKAGALGTLYAIYLGIGLSGKSHGKFRRGAYHDFGADK
ncbi:hypothetical protein GCM10027278_30960 [Paralcaligenes ginsengisoli]